MENLTSNIADEQLWSAFRDGSENAFDIIYGKMFPVLFNYGYRLCRDEEQVKDCIQNIFAEIWQKRQQLREVYSLKQYFLKIMKRKVCKEINKVRDKDKQLFSSAYREMYEDYTLAIPNPTPHHEHEAVNMTMKRLKLAVEKLSGRKKEVIQLKFYENLTTTEISEVMEFKNPKHTRQLIYRSLDELRKSIVFSHDIRLANYQV